MKTSITLLLLILFTSIIFGQDKKEEFSIEKGTWSIEGNLSINTQNSESFNETSDSNTDNFNFSISPTIGYAIKENLILGLGISYGYSKSEFENKNSQNLNQDFSRNNSYGIFTYVKKYFPVSNKFALHLQGEARFTFGNNTFDDFYDIERTSETELFFVGIRPGFNYSLTKNLLLQANFGSLGYDYFKAEIDDVNSQKANSFGFNFSSSSLIFGLTVLL